MSQRSLNIILAPRMRDDRKKRGRVSEADVRNRAKVPKNKRKEQIKVNMTHHLTM